jgi:hypothetical protein
VNTYYRLNAPGDFSESRAAVSEVDLEGYVIIQPISSLVDLRLVSRVFLMLLTVHYPFAISCSGKNVSMLSELDACYFFLLCVD